MPLETIKYLKSFNIWRWTPCLQARTVVDSCEAARGWDDRPDTVTYEISPVEYGYAARARYFRCALLTHVKSCGCLLAPVVNTSAEISTVTKEERWRSHFLEDRGVAAIDDVATQRYLSNQSFCSARPPATGKSVFRESPDFTASKADVFSLPTNMILGYARPYYNAKFKDLS